MEGPEELLERQERELRRQLRKRSRLAKELVRSEAYQAVVEQALVSLIEEFGAELENVEETRIEQVMRSKGGLNAVKRLRNGILELAELELEDEEDEEESEDE